MTAAALRRAVRALARRRSVIVAHHGVGEPHRERDTESLQVPPTAFRGQLDLLAGAGFRFVTVAELAARTAGGVPPAGLAAISFDDGMRDHHAVAWPILREYGAPATVYVVSDWIGAPNPWLEGERMMTADELRELAGAGWELGAHTATHPDLSTLGEADCLEEMRTSKAAVEEIAGAPVRTFAYPFCRYGPAALAAARAAGFEAAVTCEGRGSWEPLELKRAIVTGVDGLAAFTLKLADVYYPLFESAPGRAFRVSTRALRARGRARGDRS